MEWNEDDEDRREEKVVEDERKAVLVALLCRYVAFGVCAVCDDEMGRCT